MSRHPNPTDPLTTVFTAPTWCPYRPYSYSTDGYDQTTLFRSFNTSCYPSNIEEHTQFNGIYSPGVCPLGYTAVSTLHSGGHDAPYTSVCCPKSLTSYNSKWSCHATETTLVSVAEISVATTDYLGNALETAPPIVVAWASSELKAFKPASAPLLSGTALTVAIDHGLSAGELAAAIVVPVVAVLIGIGFLFWFFVRKRWKFVPPAVQRRHTKGQSPEQLLDNIEDKQGQPHLLHGDDKRLEAHGVHTNEMDDTSTKPELYSPTLTELDGRSPTQELKA